MMKSYTSDDFNEFFERKFKIKKKSKVLGFYNKIFRLIKWIFIKNCKLLAIKQRYKNFRLNSILKF